MTTETKHVYMPSEIDEQLAEAKRCKTFVDILNGNTPQVVAVTSDFLNGALNVGLSAAVRLGEIVEQLCDEKRGILATNEGLRTSLEETHAIANGYREQLMREEPA